MSYQKKIRHLSPKLLASAKGQICRIRLIDNTGQCRDGDSVGCHVSFTGGIMAGKVSDIFAVHGCDYCHAVIDGRITNHNFTKLEIVEAKARAMQETIQWYLDNGYINPPK